MHTRVIEGHRYFWNASLGAVGAWVLGNGLGQTNPNFAVAAGLTPVTASNATTAALNAMLADFTANGVPSKHVFRQSVYNFQVAYNTDQYVIDAGSNAQLSADGAYGPNTHDAAAAANGGSAPDVNNAASGSTTPTSTTTNNTTTTTTTTTTAPPASSKTAWIVGGALVAAAAIVGGAVYYHHGGGKQMLARRRARRAFGRHHHRVHHRLPAHA